MRLSTPLLVGAALLLMAGGSASAQTTHCAPAIIGMPSAGVNCTTTGGGSTASAPPPAYSWRDVPPTPCTRIDRFSSPVTLCAARQVAASRREVGDLIAAGRCDDALKGALATGDLQFASEVRTFCAGAASPPK